MRRPVAFGLPLLLLACAQGPTLAERLQVHVGQSEGDLVAELGVPVRSYDTEGRRFLQYEQRRSVAYTEPGLYRPWFGPYGPRWSYVPVPPSYRLLACDITFALRDGRVEGVTFRGDGCQ
jgi:hypothetical protein